MMSKVKDGIEPAATGLKVHLTIPEKVILEDGKEGIFHRRHKPFVKLGRKPSSGEIKYWVKKRQGFVADIADGKFDFSKEFPDYKGAKEYDKYKPKVLKDELPGWFEKEKVRFKPYSVKTYDKDIRNFILPTFGHLQLTEITSGVIKKAIKKETCGDGRLANKLIMLRLFLEDAHDNEDIPYNPFRDLPKLAAIKRNKSDAEGGELDLFEAGELDLLFSKMNPQDKNMYQFVMWSGLRPQEYLALEWADIDFEKREIKVNKALSNGQVGVTKTKAGNRTVIMLDGAYDALKAQQELTRWAKKTVFLNSEGKPYPTPDKAREQAWQPYFDGSIRYRPPKYMRHQYASIMLSLGEDIEQISKQMGHTNSVLFRQTYAEVIESFAPKFGLKANEYYKERG